MLPATGPKKPATVTRAIIRVFLRLEVLKVCFEVVDTSSLACLFIYFMMYGV